MSQMIRKQIYIQRRQEAVLKRAAKRRGLSEAEIIRRALDRELSMGASHLARLEGDPFDRAYKFIVARRAHVGGRAQPYRWQRQDAYEDRLILSDRKAPSSEPSG